MGILAYAEALDSVSGPVRLYPLGCDYDPSRYDVKFTHCTTLSMFFSEDHGPILYFREVFDGKNERRLIVIFHNDVIGADISEVDNCYKSYFQIHAYLSRHKCFDSLKGNCLAALRKFFESVPNLKEEADKLIPSSPRFYWPGSFNTKEKLPDFIRRVWGEYIPYGLRIAHIKTRDHRLWVAINNYRQNNIWPEDLECISQRDILRSKVSVFISEGPNSLTPKELFSVVRKITRDGNIEEFPRNLTIKTEINLPKNLLERR